MLSLLYFDDHSSAVEASRSNLSQTRLVPRLGRLPDVGALVRGLLGCRHAPYLAASGHSRY